MFAGLSTLRKQEDKKDPSVQNKALQEYLKKYVSAEDEQQVAQGERKKKKKRRPRADASSSGAVQIVDADVTGFEALEAAKRRKRLPPDERAARSLRPPSPSSTPRGVGRRC